MARRDEDQPYYRTGDAVPEPGRSYVRPIAAGVVAILFAGALWYAYQKVRGGGPVDSGGVPLIRADQAATKVKPDQPGGEAVNDQNTQVYNLGQASPQAEKLLPPAEQPMPKPQPPPEPPPVASAAPPTAVPAKPAAPVQTAAAPAPAPAKPAPAAATPAPPPPPAVPPASKPAPPPVAGGFRVQIAATKDDASAHTEWNKLQKAHADLLGSLSLTVERADLGERGVFYRIQAGPVPDRSAADKLCASLKAAIGGCIVVAPK
jgi:cell division septation protein DedD